MILDALTLENFGVYSGRHRLVLTPARREKPIILVGGMNGGGKTTILDALQLALYGKRALCVEDDGASYEDFLRASIHRGAAPGAPAGLELEFRHTSAGQESHYHVRRSWRRTESGVRESLEVLRDGTADRQLADEWGERVEDLIPARLSQLFFFDGERIEALADPQGSKRLLMTAVHGLLGLDLVDRLVLDLQIVERRNRTTLAIEAPDDAPLRESEERVAALEGQLQEVLQLSGAGRNAAERRTRDLRRAEEVFRANGGDLFEIRHALEAERTQLLEAIRRIEEGLRTTAGGAIPLMLVRDLLESIASQAESELGQSEARALTGLLRERDAMVVQRLIELDLPTRQVSAVRQLLEQDIGHRTRESEVEEFLGLGSHGVAQVHALLQMTLPTELASVQAAATELNSRMRALEKCERKLQAVPGEERIATLVGTVTSARVAAADAAANLSALDQRRELVERELETARLRRQREFERGARARLEKEDVQRLLKYSGRARETLVAFRDAVRRKHIARLESLLLESYTHLLRKRSLVCGVRIDPDSFGLTLSNGDGSEISPSSLSAGERQLLAVAMLWALARASGLTIPAVVDTPLGRLDSEHRKLMVARYFPTASHQVILLSTDEEIDREHWTAIRPMVSRAYVLEYSDESKSTAIREGYFWGDSDVS